MNIIIPMAGMGKRMRPHTLTTAKPLIPIAGKPIVQRLVEDIVATCNEPIGKIAFIIAPNFGEAVEQQLLQTAKTLGAEGKICYQEEALGTAHAILCASECLEGNVFIAFADTLFDADFKIDTQKDAIIWTQKVEDPSAFGVVKLKGAQEIEAFVEKPTSFVSDLAIIGVYYFKDGENLKKELQYLIDNDIKIKGEYQITDAMDNMLKKGIKFYTDQVKEWLDCGNKSNTLYTNQRILELKKEKEILIDPSAQIEQCTLIAPCYIGKNVKLSHAVIGPHVSIESSCNISHSVISNSIIQQDSKLNNMVLTDSMLGKNVQLNGTTNALNLGDFSCNF